MVTILKFLIIMSKDPIFSFILGFTSSQSYLAAAAAKSLQSCPTLCDPIDGSPPGSPVPGILQAITLEWVAISFSSAWKWKVKGKSLSHVRLLVTPWTAAYQASLPMGFSRQEYCLLCIIIMSLYSKECINIFFHHFELPSIIWSESEVKVKSLSHVRLLVTPWISAHQAPPSMRLPGKSTGVGCHCLLRTTFYRWDQMISYCFQQLYEEIQLK